MEMSVDQKIMEEAYVIIEKIASSRSSNGAFAYYESSDVYQEIWNMCLEAMEKYDPAIGPIENYLVTHVSNRMKNLKRDKYFRPGSCVATSGFARARMNLVNALPISEGINDTSDHFMTIMSPVNSDPSEQMIYEELIDYVRQSLPSDLVHPFDDMINNNKVRKPIADLVREEVIRIMEHDR